MMLLGPGLRFTVHAKRKSVTKLRHDDLPLEAIFLSRPQHKLEFEHGYNNNNISSLLTRLYDLMTCISQIQCMYRHTAGEEENG